MRNLFNYSLLSKYRQEIYGVAIFSIIIFHYFETVLNQGSVGLLHAFARIYVLLIGSVGVDLFLFLSGMGIYQSLKKDSTISRFYIKRLVRILIPYIVVGGCFWIVKDIVLEKNTILYFVKDIFLLTFWTEGKRVLWYVTLIFLLYLISPVLFFVVKRLNSKSYIIVVLVIAFLLLISFVFRSFFDNCEIAILRIPVYLLGFIYSDKILEKKSFSKSDLFLFAFIPVYVFCYLTNSPFSRLGTGLFSILLGLLIAQFFRLIYKKENILSIGMKKTFVLLGDISYELYLTHVCGRNLLTYLGIDLTNILFYSILIIICVVFSILIHMYINKCISYLRNVKTSID